MMVYSLNMAKPIGRIEIKCTKCSDVFIGNRNNRGLCKKCSHCWSIGKWNKNNRDRVNVYVANRSKKNPMHRVGLGLRARLREASNKKTAGKFAIRFLGCSMSEFKSYIEGKFQKGMTWKNRGYGYDKWNLDHIKPLTTFDLTNERHVKRACHYTNLRPLWQLEHFHMPRPYMRKGKR